MKNIKLFVGATLLFTVMLFGITVAVIPLVLSSDWAKNIIVNKVNTNSPGTLALGDCAIGWTKGLQCSDISYQDQGYQIDAAQLSGTQGMFALLMAPKNLGTITVDDPLVIIRQPQDSIKDNIKNDISKEGEGIASTSTSTTASQDEAEPPATDPSGTWFWHKMSGKIVLNRAVVQLQQGDQQPESVLHNGLLDLSLDSDILSLDISLVTNSVQSVGQTIGQLKAVGTAQLPSKKGNLLDLITADMQITLTDIQLAPFLALIPDKSTVPQGQVTLNSNLTMKNTEGGNVVLRGPITLTQVDLTGGFLQEDHPRLEQLAFELHLQRDEQKEWRLPELKMLSDIGSLELQSTYGKQGLQASGKGTFDLPILLTQLPGLLKAQENLRLEDGQATLAFELAEKDKTIHLQADATVKDLSGRQNKQSFVWKSPLTLSVNGSMTDKNPEIEQLALKADFLNIEGQGNIQHFSLKGSADLDKAMQEISRIIQLDWDARGRLKLDLETTKKNDRYTVQAQVDIADYQLSLNNKKVLPAHDLHLNSQLVAPGYFPKTKAEAADLTFDVSCWAGKFKGSFTGVYQDQDQIMAHYQLTSDFPLARVTELLHRFDALEHETSVAGEMKFRTSGYTEKDRLVVSTLDSRIKDFILYRQKKVLQDPHVALFTTKPESTPTMEKAVRPLEQADSKDTFFAQGGGYNLIDTKNHRLVLRNLSLNSGFADIRVEKIFLDNWQQKPAPAIKALQVSGRSDFKKVTILLQQLGLMPPEQKFTGDAIFSLDLIENKEDIKVAGTTGKGNSGTVKLDIDAFTYSKIKKNKRRRAKEELLIERQKLVFRSRLHGDLMTGDVQFTTFDIESAPLSLEAGGSLQLSGKKPHFSLNGQATPDLASLIALIEGIYPLDIQLKGKKKERFTLYYPLSAKEKENAKINLRFATKVSADYFAKSGVDMSRLTLDSNMKKGVMVNRLKGTLNDGLVRLSPRIDYRKNPPLLTIPPGEQVLTDVHLEQALTDGILKGIHPLFGSLARPAGNINVRLDHFSLPLGEKGIEKINFKVFFDLTGVALQSKGVLKSILDIAGYVDQRLAMKNKSMTCQGVQGQISCSPIKITIADSEMRISGSVGMDGRLNYVLDVPVTKRLLGKKGYELLKGTTLKVPIRGTKDKPVYSRKALMRASSDLLKQAARQATKNVLREQVDKVMPELMDNKVVPELLNNKVVPDLLNNLFGN
ncbi:hypothetical protein VU04_03455 [Desulfobulbus sp. TB]|nr:hypothetical protein [Desulfobulbus sp. TB]